MRKYCEIAVAFLCALPILSGCGGGGASGGSLQPGTITGYVYVPATSRTASAPPAGYIPLSDATVEFAGYSTTTNSEGFFSLSGNFGGSKGSLLITKNGYTPTRITIEPPPNQTTVVSPEGGTNLVLVPALNYPGWLKLLRCT